MSPIQNLLQELIQEWQRSHDPHLEGELLIEQTELVL